MVKEWQLRVPLQRAKVHRALQAAALADGKDPPDAAPRGSGPCAGWGVSPKTQAPVSIPNVRKRPEELSFTLRPG